MLGSSILILVAVALTSVLSGVLGMGGGIILMGVVALVLPVASAMVVHGVAQLAANGSRALLHPRHVAGTVIRPYLAGAALSATLFAVAGVAADKTTIYLLLGAFPFLGLALPRSFRLDVTRPRHAAACGAAVTALQLAAGASGPALDVFFLGGPLDKRAVVATKAATQTLAHALKLAYYGTLLARGEAEPFTTPAWLVVLGAAVAVAGTAVGGRLLARLSDGGFRRASRLVVLGVGAVYLARGAAGLAQ